MSAGNWGQMSTVDIVYSETLSRNGYGHLSKIYICRHKLVADAARLIEANEQRLLAMSTSSPSRSLPVDCQSRSSKGGSQGILNRTPFPRMLDTPAVLLFMHKIEGLAGNVLQLLSH